MSDGIVRSPVVAAESNVWVVAQHVPPYHIDAFSTHALASRYQRFYPQRTIHCAELNPDLSVMLEVKLREAYDKISNLQSAQRSGSNPSEGAGSSIPAANQAVLVAVRSDSRPPTSAAATLDVLMSSPPPSKKTKKWNARHAFIRRQQLDGTAQTSKEDLAILWSNATSKEKRECANIARAWNDKNKIVAAIPTVSSPPCPDHSKLVSATSPAAANTIGKYLIKSPVRAKDATDADPSFHNESARKRPLVLPEQDGCDESPKNHSSDDSTVVVPPNPPKKQCRRRIVIDDPAEDEEEGEDVNRGGFLQYQSGVMKKGSKMYNKSSSVVAPRRRIPEKYSREEDEVRKYSREIEDDEIRSEDDTDDSGAGSFVVSDGSVSYDEDGSSSDEEEAEYCSE